MTYSANIALRNKISKANYIVTKMEKIHKGKDVIRIFDNKQNEVIKRKDTEKTEECSSGLRTYLRSSLFRPNIISALQIYCNYAMANKSTMLRDGDQTKVHVGMCYN